jgi:hypothetical protein
MVDIVVDKAEVKDVLKQLISVHDKERVSFWKQ